MPKWCHVLTMSDNERLSRMKTKQNKKRHLKHSISGKTKRTA